MIEKELVSILISTFNAEKTLESSLESIFNQTYENIEVLLLDDCSTDGTQKIISKMKNKHPNLKTFFNTQNLGLTKSLNILLNNISGKYVARHDVDDFSHRDRIRLQIDFINDKNLDGCTSRAQIKNSNKITPFLSFYLSPNLVLKYKNPFIHGTLMLKRKVFEEIGFYNENFYYAQDYKLMSDLIFGNYKIKIMKDVLYTLNTQNNISSNHKTEQEYYADCVRSNKNPYRNK